MTTWPESIEMPNAGNFSKSTAEIFIFWGGGGGSTELPPTLIAPKVSRKDLAEKEQALHPCKERHEHFSHPA